MIAVISGSLALPRRGRCTRTTLGRCASASLLHSLFHESKNDYPHAEIKMTPFDF